MNSDKRNVVLGKPLNRVDGPAKVTGRARYAAEWLPPGVKFGWLLQSEITKGTIEDVDDRDALKVPGVVAVITYKNAPKLNMKPGSPFDNEMHLLQDNKIQYNRQNIGIVVADNIEAAANGAALVKFKYKEETPQVNMRADELQKTAVAPPDNHAMGVETDTHRGDADTAFGAAPVRVDQVYTTPREVHVPMEPHATTAMWDGDKLTVYDSTQGISNVQHRLANIFQLDPKNVRAVCKFTGGGFGCKGSVWSHVPLAAMASKVVGSPVCIAMERTQSFGPVGFRPRTVQQVQLGSDKSGKLQAIKHVGHIEGCTFDKYVEYVGLPTRFLYSCPNVTTAHRIIKVDIGKPTFMRAPGECPGTYALESALDELAYATGVDPVQLRLINYAEKDEQKDLVYSNKNLKQCYELGAEKFGWSKRSAQPRSMRDGKYLVGLGMSTATYPVHAFPSTARAVIHGDGTALVESGSQDLGTGTYTIMTQIAADSLGMPYSNVRFDLGDSNFPPAGVSGGSATAASLGTAVKEACDDAVAKLVALAVADTSSPLSGLPADQIYSDAGRLISKADPAKSVAFTDVLRKAGKESIEGQAKGQSGQDGKKYAMHSFGAQFCEVRVDPDLGRVHVARWVGVFDAGKIFNHKTARSQMYGGIIMGIGMALMEESVMDERYGRTVNADLAEYHVPVHADIPDIDITFVEEPDYHANPLGGHGVGELPITGAAAAVANAVYHATGVRVRDLPITLDKVLGLA